MSGTDLNVFAYRIKSGTDGPEVKTVTGDRLPLPLPVFADGNNERRAEIKGTVPIAVMSDSGGLRLSIPPGSRTGACINATPRRGLETIHTDNSS